MFALYSIVLIYNAVSQAGRLENAIGWYHSHPGYGCWLSGIDVNTQMNNQKFQDPFVAVVVRILLCSGSKIVVPHNLYSFLRSTPTERSLLAKSTLARSEPIRKTTRRPISPLRNISQSHWARSKILESTPTSTISWKSRSSSQVWIRSYWGCCGTNTGWTLWVRARWYLCVISLKSWYSPLMHSNYRIEHIRCHNWLICTRNLPKHKDP